MNILKNLFFFKENSENNIDFSNKVLDHYEEISKIVKEARIQQNLTIKELSHISKIPERIINSIENNNKNIRPEYPFIRSILIKLEECLVLKRNSLLKLAVKERKIIKKRGEGFSVEEIRSYQHMARKSFVFFYISFNYFYIKEILYFKCKYY